MRYDRTQLTPSRERRARLVWSLLILLPMLVLAGCSSDSPTEPTPNPQPPPGGGGQTAFNISVTANPTSVPSGSTSPVSISISVRRADNGSAPANGTTVSVGTTLGSFGSPDGPQSTVAELFNGNAQLTLFAGGIPGTARIQVRLQDSVGTANVAFSEGSSFFLQSVSPNVGGPEGGTRVRIAGGGFVEPVRVFFGSSLAEVLNVTPSVITVNTPQITLPAGATQPVDVSVTNALTTADEATDTLPGVFTYRRGGGGALSPQIFSVSPGSGPNEGGTQVTINGEGFQAPVQVLFGSGSADAFTGTEAEVLSVSESQIIVRAPSATGFGQSNRDQTVAILVRNLDTGATALRPSAFQYGVQVLITSVSPNQVSYEGGTRVTIFGQGFDEPVAITAAGYGQTPLSVTGTEIIFRSVAVGNVPCGGTVEDAVEVTNIETGASAIGPEFTYVGPPRPFVSSANPNQLNQSGGQTITINGGNFQDPVQVFLNGSLVNVNTFSPSQLTLTAPPISDASFDTEECDANGDGTAGSRNIPTANALTFRVVNTGLENCESETVNVSFVIQPSDTSCQGDVGDPVAPSVDFTFSVNGNDVTFNATTSGTAPVSVTWDFGDGSSAAGLNTMHTYAGPGTYTVTATATNAAGQDSVSKDVTIP